MTVKELLKELQDIVANGGEAAENAPIIVYEGRDYNLRVAYSAKFDSCHVQHVEFFNNSWHSKQFERAVMIF